MNKEKRQLKVFGYGLAIILMIIFIRLNHLSDPGIPSFFIGSAAIILSVITVFKWKWLLPVYDRWMKVAHFIGTLMTGLILAVFFYLVFGLVGIILRVLQKDLLGCAIDRDADSYWAKKDSPAPDLERYLKQF